MLEVHEHLGELDVVAEQHLVLGREVAEEGAGRHVAGGRDLLDRGVLEPLALELERGVLERAPRLLLLALAEPEREVDGREVHRHAQ